MTDIEALRRLIANDERNLRDAEKRHAANFQLGPLDEMHALKVCADCAIRWADTVGSDDDDYTDATANLDRAVALARRFR